MLQPYAIFLLELHTYLQNWEEFLIKFILAESDVVVSRPDVGERPEGEGALYLANVVLEDPLRTGSNKWLNCLNIICKDYICEG